MSFSLSTSVEPRKILFLGVFFGLSWVAALLETWEHSPPRLDLPELSAATSGAAGAQAALAAEAAEDICDIAPGTRAVCFQRVAAEYNILRRGDVMVTESLTVRFAGQWNGVERMLRERATAHDLRSASERGAGGSTGYRHVDIDVLGATDAAGNELRTETEASGNTIAVRVWVPGAKDVTRTVVLRYRISDGVTFFAEHDEFYWNVWGSESTARVAGVTTRIIPPEGTTGLRTTAFAGASGSSERNAVARIDGPVAVASTTAPLGPGLGFTVAVGWDAGIVERPGPTEALFDWLRLYGSFALPLLALGIMWSTWKRRGKDPAMLPIVTRYRPPTDLTPGEVGTLLDERADMRDVTATLVDLAVHGHLRIEETEGRKILGMEFGEDYRFVRVTQPGAGPTRSHELMLMNALFGGRDQVDLSDLKNEFYKDLPDIREAMMDSLTAHGVYTRRPDRIRAGWVVGAFLSIFVLSPALVAAQAALVAIMMVPVLTALPIGIFGWLMPARTVKGTRIIERLRGFREFLSRVDGDRLRRMKIDPSDFERILPFAMALGVEKQWGEAFEGLAQEPPRWYHSTSGRRFHPGLFASNLSRMSTATAQTMASSPGGSGGSGFGGGGSVGGGGGGGGGGGF